MLEFVTLVLLLWSPFNIRETRAAFTQTYNGQSSAVNIERTPAIAPYAGVPHAYPRPADQFRQQYNHNAHATNIGKRDAGFTQTYNDQASAVNIEGAPAVPPYPMGAPYAYPQPTTEFQQQYNHNAHATNIGKRDAGFTQTYNDQASAVNIEGAPAVAPYPVGVPYPQTATGFQQQYNHNSHATNIGKRDARAQFNQINRGGSTSYNYDCKHGGCGTNQYNQRYLAGSTGINFDYGKK